MAKSTKPATSGGVAAEVVPAHVVDSARRLLSRAEKQFFDSSFGAALAKHTHAQVQAATKQARILRNKWRDLYQTQSRSQKRSGRATEAANARTRDKHDILAGVVERFEKRLAELQEFVAHATAPAKTPAAKPAVKAPPRSKPAAKSKAARAAKTVTVKSKKASRRVTNGLAAGPAAQLVRFDRSQQRSALTAAKASRIKRG
ncbi:MAG: hypothetical protein EBZ59_12355, partial [Planctomycetia bacterium]|nr:hypothetical protein [Planctomycetia bacterium]